MERNALVSGTVSLNGLLSKLDTDWFTMIVFLRFLDYYQGIGINSVYPESQAQIINTSDRNPNAHNQSNRSF